MFQCLLLVTHQFPSCSSLRKAATDGARRPRLQAAAQQVGIVGGPFHKELGTARSVDIVHVDDIC